MKKEYNKKLEPWLCCTIVLHNRTFDIYFREEQINPWYYALSLAVKKYNKDAYCMTYGKFLWYDRHCAA